MNGAREYRLCAGVWIALIVLLAATCASAYVPLGVWNSVANLVIAFVKVALVALFFMHLKSGSAAIRLYAVTALFALALLFGLTLADYEVRDARHTAYQQPQQGLSHAPSLR
jgi:cytochrome c oxidase subunit IV